MLRPSGLCSPPRPALGAVLSRCTLEEVRRAPYADVNLVLRGKGRELAQAMKEYFGIPWEELDYPYGAAGADDLWSRLERRFGLDYHQARAELDRQIAEGAGKAYRYLQALYGMPAAILASGPRADGLRRFLEQELGMGGGVLCPPGGALRPGGLLPGAARLRVGASVRLLL